MSPRLISLLFLAAIGLAAGAAQEQARAQEAVPPRRVEVLPVFFIPKGEPAPTKDQAEQLVRHLDWTRTRYRELLPKRTTFKVAGRGVREYRAEQGLEFYRAQPEASAPQVVSELLAELKHTRYNCPYVLLVVMMNHKDGFPVGGGRPLNGGFNTGGGIVILSSFNLDRSPNFQSTLQHELGHAFGLPHVDVYGYDMRSNDSLMSYNPGHHTNGFTPSRTPGKLIPEDLRGLALNKRVFPYLRFDPQKDVPQVYSMAARIVTLGPMRIPGQSDGVQATTDSGEERGSKIASIVRGRVAPNARGGQETFDARTMWQSAEAPAGRVSVQIAFPYDVELTRVAIHSQHGGEHHAARAVAVFVRDSAERFSVVQEADLKSADETVKLPRTKGREWRFEFLAGPSRRVVLRGLRFFSGKDELFPPLIPCEP